MKLAKPAAFSDRYNDAVLAAIMVMISDAEAAPFYYAMCLVTFLDRRPSGS